MKKREKKEKESEMKKKRSFIPFIQKKHIERGKSKAKEEKKLLGERVRHLEICGYISLVHFSPP